MRLLSNVSAVSEANEPRLNRMAPCSAFDSRASELFSCHAWCGGEHNESEQTTAMQAHSTHTHTKLGNDPNAGGTLPLS